MIKQPFFALIALALLVAAGWFVMDRLTFLHTAERTAGKVVSVSARNDRCGGRRSRHSCTRYTAHINFSPLHSSGTYNLSISAGSHRGYDQPVNYASHTTGDAVQVVYNPKKPDEAYEDSLMGVWGTPIMLAIGQLISFFTSLTEPRRRSMLNS
jgi:hypothetical protein